VAKKKATTEEKLPDDIGMLDNLITELYKELLATIGAKGKLGDLLKMIELRRKLAPQESAQKAFWEMMARIREEAMPKMKRDAANAPAPAGDNAPTGNARGGRSRKGAR